MNSNLASSAAIAFAFLAAVALALTAAPAPRKDVNYEESKVGSYSLPDPLTLANGAKVSDAKSWREQRRPEILKLFQTHVYGRSPAQPRGMTFALVSVDTQALGGMATRKEVTVCFTGKKDGPSMNLLLYVPNKVKKPAPAFLGLNFGGNHVVHPDPAIALSTRWMREAKDKSVVHNRATEVSRGDSASRWQVEKVLARGYAVATVYYGDIEPDHAEGWKDGVRAALSKDGANTQWQPDDWGAVGAWAWGLSRALDYLETDKDIDARRVAVHGHSRLGKTSLWAGATDERFAIVISNDSGCGGAALNKRLFGETVGTINRSFPHWFCGNFKQYNENEVALPVDQHELIALIAPRPVYVASAEDDQWADPRGEFLSAKNAEPVYALFQKAGLGVSDMPPVNHPVGEFIGYHIRTGKHDITDYDWEQYLNFADKHFGKPQKVARAS